LCGKKVLITNPKNGKSVKATVAGTYTLWSCSVQKKKTHFSVLDACPTCTNENCLDLSKAAFLSIATEDEGEVAIKWSFI
jgi:expansin (peptidoglycan-binding protein)